MRVFLEPITSTKELVTILGRAEYFYHAALSRKITRKLWKAESTALMQSYNSYLWRSNVAHTVNPSRSQIKTSLLSSDHTKWAPKGSDGSLTNSKLKCSSIQMERAPQMLSSSKDASNGISSGRTCFPSYSINSPGCVSSKYLCTVYPFTPTVK